MSEAIIKKAKELGFIEVGFSTPREPLYFEEFKSWVSAHKNAGMSWLERSLNLRENPSLLLKGCRTIISLAYPYSSHKPETTDGLTASRYSKPDQDDYHYRLKALCSELVRMLRDMEKGCNNRICIDSAPVLERSLAHSAGIGFIGKNNMLIIPGYGSYFYLAEILTTVPLDIMPIKQIENSCDSCMLCIEACPSGALEKPFCLDASKCLSYLTIEYKARVSEADGRNMGDCFFGCDRCQEVCPFNGSERRRDTLLPSADKFLIMDNDYFLKSFGKTAFARAGFEKIKTNIQVIKRART